MRVQDADRLATELLQLTTRLGAREQDAGVASLQEAVQHLAHQVQELHTARHAISQKLWASAAPAQPPAQQQRDLQCAATADTSTPQRLQSHLTWLDLVAASPPAASPPAASPPAEGTTEGESSGAQAPTHDQLRLSAPISRTLGERRDPDFQHLLLRSQNIPVLKAFALWQAHWQDDKVRLLHPHFAPLRLRSLKQRTIRTRPGLRASISMLRESCTTSACAS